MNLNYFRKLDSAKTVLIIDKDCKKNWIILDDADVRDHNLMWWMDREYGKIIDIEATKQANKELKEKYKGKVNINSDINIKQMR